MYDDPYYHVVSLNTIIIPVIFSTTYVVLCEVVFVETDDGRRLRVI